MGFDITTLKAMLISIKYTKKKDLLMLGRQQIHTKVNGYNYGDYSEQIFYDLGFENVQSIDNNSYENASIIFNLNKPFIEHLFYDYIFDGGTTEHIFNIPQVYENIINMLKIDGIFCSVTCNNNFSGHGLYQFSPDFFISIFNKKYGMELLELYLAEIDSDVKDWVKIEDNFKFRNFKFRNYKQIYIITIAKKITENRESLITNPPNQYLYEQILWEKK